MPNKATRRPAHVKRLTQGLVALMLALVAMLSPAPAFAAGFSRVVVVVLENTDYATAIAQPFMKSLSSKGALLTNFSAETHPSQPNYITMIAGSALGVDEVALPDGNVTRDARHLGNLLESKGRNWRVYAEGYPGAKGNCYLGARSGGYVRKHVPFLSFKDVQTTSRCNKVVSATIFAADAKAGRLPAYTLYVPTLDNDGHDTGAAFADAWLKTTIGPLLADSSVMKNTLVVVTFDEGVGKGAHVKSHIATWLIGPMVKPGATSARAYTHNSLLRTIEDTFALGTLGRGDATARPITGVWK
ncbi:alkaline phosphatase family protein [Oryzibacter oryziterrae]|uniref:alkaline phosphatase family protein n=1 Tax=Oryzibacter oryziterrae TaxID=2766474 RepID=UPI001F436E6E|nr:alkaline phosphatase family protein [Oryzibacter oryziterrae]